MFRVAHSAEQQRGRRASVARDLQNTKFQFAEVKMCLSVHRAPIALSPGRGRLLPRPQSGSE